MLHIVNKSPFQSNTLTSCLRVAQAGHSVLLIEDGIYAATSGSALEVAINKAAEQLKFFALKPDVDARGMSAKVMPNITLVDYKGFVELVAQNNTSHSWL
jgi:tRNA 2-thiouridine synthesizing protein B